MKLSSIVHLLLAAATATTAGAISKPCLSLSVANGDYDGIASCLCPNLKWSDKSCIGGGGNGTALDLGYGLETSNPFRAALPQKLFGTLSTKLAGWGVAFGTTKNEGEPTGITATATSSDERFKVSVSGDTKAGVKTITSEAELGLGSNNTSLFLDSSYFVEDNSVHLKCRNDATGTDVGIRASMEGYDVALQQPVGDSTKIDLGVNPEAVGVTVRHTLPTKTQVELSAQTDGLRSVIVTQPIGATDTVTATLTEDGGLPTIVWGRDLDGKNDLVATIVPGEAIDVEWKDCGWKTNIGAGINGTSICDVCVSTKREVVF